MKYLIFLLFGLFACSKNISFEREQDLFKYLNKTHSLNFLEDDKDYYVVILQDGFCGACTGEVMLFLLSFYEKVSKESTMQYLVLAKDTPAIRQRFNHVTHLQYLVDKDYSLQKHGLRYTSDLLFKIRNQKIIYWAKLREENMKQINKDLLP